MKLIFIKQHYTCNQHFSLSPIVQL